MVQSESERAFEAEATAAQKKGAADEAARLGDFGRLGAAVKVETGGGPHGDVPPGVTVDFSTASVVVEGDGPTDTATR